MSVLKRNSVCFGGGVDISNIIELPKPPRQASAPAQEEFPEPARDPEQELLEEKRKLEQRIRELDEREQKLAQEE